VCPQVGLPHGGSWRACRLLVITHAMEYRGYQSSALGLQCAIVKRQAAWGQSDWGFKAAYCRDPNGVILELIAIVKP
jgi:hypothetical protein